MAINLSALSNVTTAAKALSNLILVSPQQVTGYQPQLGPSYSRETGTPPKAILFNYEGEQVASLTTDITDHYIEDNSTIQDQAALKPVLITTQGFIGELNDIAPAALEAVKEVAEKLTTVGSYVPQLSTTALLAYANAFQLYQTASSIVDSAVQTWSSILGDDNQSVINGAGLIPGGAPQTKQQIYFQQFYGYWQNRTLFSIQTPWAIFQDMMIQTLTATQSAETNVITDFQITFKQLRFASTQQVGNVLYSDNNNFMGRAFSQGARVLNLGTSTLEPSPLSARSLFTA